MRFILACFLFSLLTSSLFAQSKNQTVYLFPGQGSDIRIYNNIDCLSTYDTLYMALPTPKEGESMKEYASRFISKIDTTENFTLVGVSLGGMVCTELASILKPDKVIIISSAKNWKELPKRYSFQRKVKLNRAIPENTIKKGALVLQPIVEADSKKDRDVFYSMLSAKNPTYLKRTIDMIINWDRKIHSDNIIHIHGTKDKTIPFRNVKATYKIKGGSHMMVYTRGKEISNILKHIIEK